MNSFGVVLSGAAAVLLLGACSGGQQQARAEPRAKQAPQGQIDCRAVAPAAELGEAIGQRLEQDQLQGGLSQFPSCSLSVRGGGLVAASFMPKPRMDGKPGKLRGNAAVLRAGGGPKGTACAIDVLLAGDKWKPGASNMTVNVDLYGKAKGDPCVRTRKAAETVFDGLREAG